MRQRCYGISSYCNFRCTDCLEFNRGGIPGVGKGFKGSTWQRHKQRGEHLKKKVFSRLFLPEKCLMHKMIGAAIAIKRTLAFGLL